jgi:S1-C subfamily serine protease
MWAGGLIVGSDEFKIIACERMKIREYTVLGGENLLFGKDDSAKAEFQLGATLQTLQYNTYAPLAGNFSESGITVEWQVNDALRNEVIFKKTTGGSARTSGITVQCVKDAFLLALDNLLSDPEFIHLVKLRKQTSPSTTGDAREVIEIAMSGSEKCLSLPRDMEEALKSVILIRSGGTIGSGVVFSDDGYALTAAHVVSPLREVSVQMRSGLELTATVIRVDREQDIALIKLPGRGHAFLPLVRSSAANVGSDLFAVGAPSGESLAFSVTKGVVSGFREVRGRRYIQTDTALSPGNSGGPLLSSEGKVVAIVSWKIVAPGFEGLSFGVPVSAILETLNVKLR